MTTGPSRSGVRTVHSDAGLASWEGRRDPEAIDLSGTRGNDRVLERLRGLKRLNELHVRGTSVTKEGRDRFRDSMPGLKEIE